MSPSGSQWREGRPGGLSDGSWARFGEFALVIEHYKLWIYDQSYLLNPILINVEFKVTLNLLYSLMVMFHFKAQQN